MSDSLEAMHIEDILKAVPHRYPFLWIDRNINIRGDDSAVEIKT